MKKATWKAFKDEVNKIKQEIAKLNSSKMFATDDTAAFAGF